MSSPVPHTIHAQNTTKKDLASSFQEIDHQIQRLQSTIIELRRRRNTLTPIYHLPPEVLSRIFSEHSSLFPESYKWLLVTHVSRHWREVARTTPTLWSNIHLKYADACIEEVLTHSKASLLTVNCDRKLNLAHLDGHIPRIRHLSFLDIDGDSLHEIGKFLTKPAPKMEKLVIACRYSGLHPLPSSVFESAPNLQKLHLIRCSLQWDSFTCPSLTNLSINNVQHSPTLSQLFGFLKQLPSLSRLSLCHALRDAPHSADIEVNIDLPALSSLQLGDNSVDSTAYFLRHARVPRTANISISCYAARASAAPLIRTLSTHYSDVISRMQYSNSIVIDCNPYQTALSALEGFEERPWLYISVQAASEPHTELQSQLIGLFRHLPLEELLSLHVDGPALNDDCLAMISTAPKLSKMYLSSIVGLSVIQSFGKAKPGCAHSDENPLQDTATPAEVKPTTSVDAPMPRALSQPAELADCISCDTFRKTFFPSLTHIAFTALDFGSVDLGPFFRTLSYCRRLQYGVKSLDCRSCKSKELLLKAIEAAGIETATTPDAKRPALKPIQKPYGRGRRDQDDVPMKSPQIGRAEEDNGVVDVAALASNTAEVENYHIAMVEPDL